MTVLTPRSSLMSCLSGRVASSHGFLALHAFIVDAVLTWSRRAVEQALANSSTKRKLMILQFVRGIHVLPCTQKLIDCLTNIAKIKDVLEINVRSHGNAKQSVPQGYVSMDNSRVSQASRLVVAFGLCKWQTVEEPEQ